MGDEPLLEVRNLEKHFTVESGFLSSVLGREQKKLHAVDSVSFDVNENEAIGVIGESGCGKSTLLMTLMGLHTPTGGTILFEGNDIREFNKKEWKALRRNMSIIFQDPFNSLDPKMTVEEIVKEPLKVHNIDNQDEKVVDVLQQVELNPPERYLHRLPGQLSGGEKQRVSIARALVVEPKIILADEPVSMLDVSTQASILRLLSRLRDEHSIAIIYISHDLSTVSYVCDYLHVQYLGRIIESGETNEVINDPKHPYTKALMGAIPIPDPFHERERTELEGTPGDPIDLGEGCRFRERCPDRMPVCEHTPETVNIDGNHYTSCHLYYDHENHVEAGTSYETDQEVPSELNN